MTSFTRTPPASVRRQLRREAGFGCVVCGHPFIEYHHIIPWALEKHMRPKDMVAVCPNHHTAFSFMPEKAQREAKRNPHNIKTNSVQGQMVVKDKKIDILVGSNRFTDNSPRIVIDNEFLLTCKVHKHQVLFTITIKDEEGNLVFRMKDNEIFFRPDNVWDFQGSHNHVTIRSAPRNITLEIDFRKTPAILRGKFWVNKKSISVDTKGLAIEDKASNFTASFQDLTFKGGSGAFIPIAVGNVDLDELLDSNEAREWAMVHFNSSKRKRS